MEYVKNLFDVRLSDADDVGGKAANLGEMLYLGLPVPAGIVVTSNAYRRHLELVNVDGFLTKVERELRRSPSLERIDYLSRRARQVMGIWDLAGEIRTLLVDKADEIFYSIDAYGKAIRSSAIDEDGEGASFAGQHSTYLGVKGFTGIVERVRDCYASLFNREALSYRVEKGLSLRDMAIAVVVQSMPSVHVSGVMFTRDPNTQENKILIQSVRGLGEGLVSGQVTPDTYEMRPDGSILRKSNNQSIMFEAKGDGTTVRHSVPISMMNSPHLSTGQVEELADYALRLESHYEGPQDVEWVMDVNGDMWIVQTRPLTTTEVKVRAELAEAPILWRGDSASYGVGTGKPVYVSHKWQLDSVGQGDVLVTEMTTPDFVPVFSRISALVTEKGGVTCHAAIVSREYNLPCVVNVGDANAIPTTGMVTVDGSNGVVYDGVVDVKA